MTKRLITAVGLSIAILIAYNFVMRRFLPAPAPVNITGTEPSAVEEKAKIRAQEPGTLAPAAAIEPGERKPVRASSAPIRVETKFYKIEFAPDGKIEHWFLKEYKGYGPTMHRFLIQYRTKQETPVDLALGTETLPRRYKSSVSMSKDKKKVIFFSKSDGIKILKEITFEEEKYYSTMHFEIVNESGDDQRDVDIELFRWGPTIADSKDPRQLTFMSYQKGKLLKYNSGKIKKIDEDAQKDALWCSINEKHFTVALLPRAQDKDLSLSLKKEGFVTCALKVKEIEKGKSITGNLKIYAAPKSHELLKKEGSNLEQIANFGFIGQGIFWLLKVFYSFTKNYGLAIILISVLIKLILLPLSYRGAKSMQEMQRVQPQLEMLKQRFKHDQEALNRETMELYKRLKINPLGGCLPIVLQMPVFFALFSVLQNAIELRQAPFMLWIQDLSMPDTWLVLPIVMGLTTFLQQKMTPSTSSQSKGMSTFMTIFLTFIFLSFPAGLVLYWLINNILSIGEQYLIKTRA